MKVPFPSVTVETVVDVASFLTVTVAPGRTPFDPSMMVPPI